MIPKIARLMMLIPLAFLIAATCGGDRQSAPPPPPTPRPAVTACAADNAACATAQRAQLPTPEPPDPGALAILRSDPAVTVLLAGLTAGKDYWLGFDEAAAENERGERLATITIIFREEFHFSGPIPLFNDPCSGVGGEDHPVPANHPCRTEPRTYRTEAVNWTGGSRLLHATIDRDRHAVVELFNPVISASVDFEIKYYREHYDGSY